MAITVAKLNHITLFFLQFNMTHHIKQLSFGMEYPGMDNPLDNMLVTDVKGKYIQALPQMKIIGTVFHSSNNLQVCKYPNRLRGCAEGLWPDHVD